MRDVGSVVIIPRLESTGSIVVVHWLSCSTACGIFLDQGWNSVSPVLAGRFFTTESAAKPLISNKSIFITGTETDELVWPNNVHFPLLLLFSLYVMSDSFATPWTTARQAPLSMGSSREEYCSGLPCPPPGDLPDPGIKPTSPAWQMDSLPLNHQGSPTSAFTTAHKSL